MIFFFFSMHRPLKSFRTRAIVITVIASVRAQRCHDWQPPRPTSRHLSVPGQPAGRRVERLGPGGVLREEDAVDRDRVRTSRRCAGRRRRGGGRRSRQVERRHGGQGHRGGGHDEEGKRKRGGQRKQTRGNPTGNPPDRCSAHAARRPRKRGKREETGEAGEDTRNPPDRDTEGPNTACPEHTDRGRRRPREGATT